MTTPTQRGIFDCIVTGSVAALIPVGGEVTGGGIIVACLVGGLLGVADS
jgi:hypothetical protein